MKIWWCQEHGHSAYLKLQPDRGCWAEAVNGKLCRMVPMRLIPDNGETVELMVQAIARNQWGTLPVPDRDFTAFQTDVKAILAAFDGETP